MVWDHLDVDTPHVAYACVGVFSAVFSLVSLFIKERLYIGEATVASIFGLIIGPHCLDWFDPSTWGNEDKITLEISRMVLIIQIFAVAVELPKKYMLKHWFPVALLLVPVMTAGWLIVGLFIWILIPGLNFSYSILVAACVTATDPVLAAAVVGKGKFAKRVPGHLRNILSAESGCNDGMAFPFIYLALNLVIHAGHAGEIIKEWICVTILYECIFGCILGAAIGYAGRQAIKWSEKKDLIDRESLLAFYIVLSFCCAGFGAMLGVDDLLVSFAAGTAFAWDGWFIKETEESQVSTVIDLLLNLSYFVYFGSIIPWASLNDASLGLNVWRLIILAIVIIFLRRVPAVFAIKPFNKDIKNWKEALFVGHFGPIGVGAVFAAILTIGELEAHVEGLEHGPTSAYPDSSEYYQLIRVIWPIVCFCIITSIIVHGSSVAVMTLGRHLQTMTFTMTFTRTETEGGGWTNRLPKLEASGTSFSIHRIDTMQPSTASTNSGLLGRAGDLKSDTLLSNSEMVDVETARRPATGAKTRHQRRKIRKRMKGEKRGRKNPPVAQTLDLRLKNRANTNENDVVEEEEDEEIVVNTTPVPVVEKIHQEGYGPSDQGEDYDEDDDDTEEKLEHELQQEEEYKTNKGYSSGSSSGNANDPEQVKLHQIQQNYDISETDLQPQIDPNSGDVRIPTTGYGDGSKLIIEDQHGEVMHTVTSHTGLSRQNSVLSIGSLKHHLGKIRGLGSRDNSQTQLNPLDDDEDVEVPVEALDNASYSPVEEDDEFEEAKLPQARHPKKMSLRKKLRKKVKARGQRLHGYRSNDQVIIENDDGDIIGRYKLSQKKKAPVAPPSGSAGKQNTSNYNRMLQVMGLRSVASEIATKKGYGNLDKLESNSASGPQDVDLEAGEAANDEIVPEQQTGYSGRKESKMERKLKLFLRSDPRQVRVKNEESEDSETSIDSEDDYDYGHDEDDDDIDDDDDSDDEYSGNRGGMMESAAEKARRLAALATSYRHEDDEEDVPKSSKK